MKKLISDFKDFINRGNIMDLAVGIIIGSAFTGVVNSLVSDILTPLITGFSSETSFKDMSVAIPTFNGSITLAYGNFINAALQFVFIALVVFFLMKGMTGMQKSMDALTRETHETAPHCPFCMEEVKAGATRCPHCTAELPEPAEAGIEQADPASGLLAGALSKAGQTAVGRYQAAKDTIKGQR